MNTLMRTIQNLNDIKHRLLESAATTSSDATRRRELRAAVDIHKTTKKLDKILQSLVPFKIEALTTEEPS